MDLIKADIKAWRFQEDAHVMIVLKILAWPTHIGHVNVTLNNSVVIINIIIIDDVTVMIVSCF